MSKEIHPRLLRMSGLVKYCSLSRAYIYLKIKEGSFPPGKKLSIGVTAFEKSEVDTWLNQQMGGK